MRNLEQSLSAERAQLSRLVKETSGYVGGIAANGYKALTDMPVLRQPYEAPALSRDGRRFSQRGGIPSIDMPDGPIRLDDEVTVLGISTEALHRGWYSRCRLRQFSAQDKLVSVSFTHPGIAENTVGRSLLTVTSSGNASYNKRPHATEPIQPKDDLRDYASPKELRGGYAATHLNRLVITSLVTTSLARAYDIESNTAQHDDLVARWQEVLPADQPFEASIAKIVH